ncbi:hypothetical protein [Niabella sp.]|uniref:hypothetical protein n=1 Tax=Niabella sp. TaxID=1962976 RepID=UPI00260A5F0A|nr:hypothetical protein [Niabella sp.]
MEQERLKFCVERYDHYYDSINNKATVFLTLGTFITGGLVAGYPTLLEKVNCGICIHLLMGLLLSLGLAIMIIVAWTSVPFLKSGGNSLYYFNDISAIPMSDFGNYSQSVTEADEILDLREQVYQLAAGLSGKFKKLRIAGYLLITQFFLFIPLIIVIISNLKK